MSTNTKKNKRFRLGNILVFLMLTALPLGSYIYLDRGYDYRKTVLSELEELGPMPLDLIQLSDYPDSVLIADSVFVVASYIPLSDEAALKASGPHFQKLALQFANRSDVYFVFFHDPAARPQSIRNFLANYELEELELVRTVPLAASQRAAITNPNGWNRTDAGYPILLSDPQGIVRKHYAATNLVEAERLVHHLAVLLPQDKKAKARVVRETTK